MRVFITQLSLILFLFGLSSCGKPEIKSDSGLKTGEYRIIQYNILPHQDLKADNLVQGAPQEFEEFRQVLSNTMPTQLARHIPVSGKEVGINITVHQINLEVNNTRAALWGDAIQVWTEVHIIDVQNQQIIGTVPVNAMSKVTAGLLGIILDSGDDGALARQRSTQALADLYTKNLIETLYPKQ